MLVRKKGLSFVRDELPRAVSGVLPFLPSVFTSGRHKSPPHFFLQVGSFRASRCMDLVLTWIVRFSTKLREPDPSSGNFPFLDQTNSWSLSKVLDHLATIDSFSSPEGHLLGKTISLLALATGSRTCEWIVLSRNKDHIFVPWVRSFSPTPGPDLPCQESQVPLQRQSPICTLVLTGFFPLSWPGPSRDTAFRGRAWIRPACCSVAKPWGFHSRHLKFVAATALILSNPCRYLLMAVRGD